MLRTLARKTITPSLLTRSFTTSLPAMTIKVSPVSGTESKPPQHKMVRPQFPSPPSRSVGHHGLSLPVLSFAYLQAYFPNMSQVS